jgi:hypothetical protein
VEAVLRQEVEAASTERRRRNLIKKN